MSSGGNVTQGEDQGATDLAKAAGKHSPFKDGTLPADYTSSVQTGSQITPVYMPMAAVRRTYLVSDPRQRIRAL